MHGFARVALMVAGVVGCAPPALAGGDFDGDGRDDIAVGVPNEDVNFVIDVGVVDVVYPRDDGDFVAQRLRRGAGGVPGTPANFDAFGRALAIGDFDADGFDDLAIGVPGKTIRLDVHLGEVDVFYGGPSGLSAARLQIVTRAGLGSGAGGSDEEFGTVLESGDFDGDGFDDLAIASPLETLGGGIRIVRGTATGLDATTGALIVEPGGPFFAEFFGARLRRGDFDGDGFTDLAAANFERSASGLLNVGVTYVFFGSPAGLSPASFATLSQADFSGQVMHENAFFGLTLESGDFDGDGFDELAIAAGASDGSGLVHVARGSASGPVPSTTISRTDFGVPAAPNDSFGSALTSADVTGDGRADLVVGVPGHDLAKGAVAFLKGSATGLRPVRIFAARVEGGAAFDDRFGFMLATGDYTGDSRVDVAVGIPLDDVGAVSDGGSVTLLAKPRAPRMFFTQNVLGVGDVAEARDAFGEVLAR